MSLRLQLDGAFLASEAEASYQQRGSGQSHWDFMRVGGTAPLGGGAHSFATEVKPRWLSAGQLGIAGARPHWGTGVNASLVRPHGSNVLSGALGNRNVRVAELQRQNCSGRTEAASAMSSLAPRAGPVLSIIFCVGHSRPVPQASHPMRRHSGVLPTTGQSNAPAGRQKRQRSRTSRPRSPPSASPRSCLATAGGGSIARRTASQARMWSWGRSFWTPWASTMCPWTGSGPCASPTAACALRARSASCRAFRMCSAHTSSPGRPGGGAFATPAVPSHGSVAAIGTARCGT